MHHQGRTAVYRCYDRTDQLVYVGITNSPAVRWAMHAADKKWWPEVALREVEWFDSRREAEKVEAHVIGAMQPRWNVAPGMPDREAVFPKKVRRGWTPPAPLQALVRRYEQSEEERSAARDALEQALVVEMLAGVSATRLAKFLPWSENMLRGIAKRGNVPPLRKPTVIGIRRYERIYGEPHPDAPSRAAQEQPGA